MKRCGSDTGSKLGQISGIRSGSKHKVFGSTTTLAETHSFVLVLADLSYSCPVPITPVLRVKVTSCYLAGTWPCWPPRCRAGPSTSKYYLLIFGRNLALLASSLQGRTQYEFPLFRSRNHLTLFSIAMGLLELAR